MGQSNGPESGSPSFIDRVFNTKLTRRAGLKAATTLAGVAAAEATDIPGIALSAPKESPDFQNIPLVLEIRLPDGSMGIFDRRANGMGDNPATNTDLKGYIVSGPVLDAYKANGGDSVWGPPVSREFRDDLGRITQYTQRGGFQITVDAKGQTVNTEYANIFDGLRQAEINLDDETSMIPKYIDWSSDKDLKWGHDEKGALPGTVEDNHISSTFDSPRAGITSREQALLKGQYLANKKWFEQYGLPMGIKKYLNGVVAVVAQRAALHLWPDATPWSQKDVPVIVNGGDILKKLVVQGAVRNLNQQIFATQDNPFPSGGRTDSATPEAAPAVTKAFPEKLGGDQKAPNFEVTNLNPRIGVTANEATVQLLSQKAAGNEGQVQTIIHANMEDARKALQGEAKANTWNYPIPVSFTDIGITDIGWVYQKINAQGVLEQHIGFIDGAADIIEHQALDSDARFPGVDIKALRLNSLSFSVSLIAASSAQYPTLLPPSRPEIFDEQRRRVHVIDPELKRVASEQDPLLKLVLV